MDEETTDLIKEAIDKILAENPCGVCLGYLDHRVRLLLKMKNAGVRGELLEQVMKQVYRNN